MNQQGIAKDIAEQATDVEQTGSQVTGGGEPGQNSPVSISQLENAFNLFNRVSVELDTSYKDLEVQVVELNRQLTKSRTDRIIELQKKENQVQRLSALISVLPSGVVLLDKNSVVADANPKAIELLGEPLLGLSWSGVVARVAAPEVRAGFELKLRDGRILSVTSRDLEGSSDRVIMITEVTSIHHMQERVNRDKRLAALGEMAASLAHQIRTPLSSALLYMSQLSLSKLPQEVRVPMAGKVKERLNHINSLTDSMLNFVRGAKPSRETICLSNLIEKAGQLVRLSAAQSFASIEFPKLDNSILIQGDIEALAGAIANLILNAIEINPGEPKVTLWAGAINPTQIQIRVTDNGPGIASENLDKVFNPFFTTRPNGTGLGLSVVAMTVEAHEGDIQVANHKSGGAEFTITLPMLNTARAVGVTEISGADNDSRRDTNRKVA